MPTKEQLSDRVNVLLGITDIINFSNMNKEDLERFVKYLETDFSDPSTMIKTGINRMRENVRDKVLDRPLRDFLNPGLLEAQEGEETGPLGFGFLKTQPVINLKKALERRKT